MVKYNTGSSPNLLRFFRCISLVFPVSTNSTEWFTLQAEKSLVFKSVICSRQCIQKSLQFPEESTRRIASLFRHCGISLLRLQHWKPCLSSVLVDHGGPVFIILATGSEVSGFSPGRGRWIFSESKNAEYDLLRKGSKPWIPRRRFTARKRTSSRNQSL